MNTAGVRSGHVQDEDDQPEPETDEGDEERSQASDRDQGNAGRQNAPEERKECALARERPRERFMGEQPANLTE
jgi:hypothetical protein